jgi:hypothetical protein
MTACFDLSLCFLSGVSMSSVCKSHVSGGDSLSSGMVIGSGCFTVVPEKDQELEHDLWILAFGEGYSRSRNPLHVQTDSALTSDKLVSYTRVDGQRRFLCQSWNWNAWNAVKIVVAGDDSFSLSITMWLLIMAENLRIWLIPSTRCALEDFSPCSYKWEVFLHSEFRNEYLVEKHSAALPSEFKQ